MTDAGHNHGSGKSTSKEILLSTWRIEICVNTTGHEKRQRGTETINERCAVVKKENRKEEC